ncbi:MAG: ketosteroid isomerase-related protein [Sphingobium sp.]
MSTTAYDESLALVARYYAAFNKGAFDAMLDCLSDDVAHDINQGGRETGKQAFRAFMAKMDSAYTEKLRDIVIMANPDGSHVAAEFVVQGVYKIADEGMPPAHGQSYALPAGAFLEVKQGRIARVSTYYNLADWIAQVS